MNQMKLIDKHYEWMEKGEICSPLRVLFIGEDLQIGYQLHLMMHYTGNKDFVKIPYTDTLQNIVLLICAMEGEFE